MHELPSTHLSLVEHHLKLSYTHIICFMIISDLVVTSLFILISEEHLQRLRTYYR